MHLADRDGGNERQPGGEQSKRQSHIGSYEAFRRYVAIGVKDVATREVERRHTGVRRKIAVVRGSLLLVLVALTACGGSQPAQAPQAQNTSTAPAAASTPRPQRSPVRSAASTRDEVRDLSVDESMGGHTLNRHVGRTDAELAERLRREPQISAASTWTDRDTAERAVAAALASADGRLTSWERRPGRRPNLALHYTDRSGATLGRSLSRGEGTSVPCSRALVVLKWDDRRDRFYVLTAYPEADR
jgi:hypothetical protein